MTVATAATSAPALVAGHPASAGTKRASAPHANKAPKPPRSTASPTPTATATSTSSAPAPTGGGAPSFSVGQLNGVALANSGCGTNTAGEPSLHVSRAGLTVLGSESGLGGGSQVWTGSGPGGNGASACSLSYQGQPNAVGGVGASGGDIDTAIAPAADAAGHYRIYVASLNLASINVASSSDDGRTFSQVPVQTGVPVDDREWIAAYGQSTSLLTYHDIVTNNIDVLRSDSGGGPYVQIGTAIPPTDYKASNNELGNLVIDHRSGSGASTSPFDAYQAFVAPSADPGPAGLVSGAPYNEAFVAVSTDGGHTFNDKAIPCSVSARGTLNHQFPNVSVAPNGSLLETWSDDSTVYAARSTDHGSTWTCSAVSSGLTQAVEPWVVATDSGADLVFYGTSDAAGPNQLWSVYLAQATGTGGFGSPRAVTPVHRGSICESGASCTTGRQLFDDFAVDTDPQGYAHIAFSHDSPGLGGSGTYTGYAVQTGGSTVGAPNN
ncbi:MAG: hypothetical protein NVSMB55_26840 [Mycobacteriales bacterium]